MEPEEPEPEEPNQVIAFEGRRAAGVALSKSLIFIWLLYTSVGPQHIAATEKCG